MKETRIINGKRQTFIAGYPASREIRSGKSVWVTYPPQKKAEAVPVPVVAEIKAPPPPPKASKKQVLAEISKQLAMRR